MPTHALRNVKMTKLNVFINVRAYGRMQIAGFHLFAVQLAARMVFYCDNPCDACCANIEIACEGKCRCSIQT